MNGIMQERIDFSGLPHDRQPGLAGLRWQTCRLLFPVTQFQNCVALAFCFFFALAGSIAVAQEDPPLTGGGPGGGGGSGPPFFNETHLLITNAVRTGTGFTVYYSVQIPYDHYPYIPWIKLELPNSTYTDKQFLDPSQMTVGPHEIYLETGAGNIPEGGYTVVFGLIPGPPSIRGTTGLFMVQDGAVIGSEFGTVQPGVVQLLGETPYPNTPIDVLCGSCEETSRRGGRALCPTIGNDGLFAIKLSESGSSGGCPGPSTCTMPGEGERPICISEEACNRGTISSIPSCSSCSDGGLPQTPGNALITQIRSSPWNTYYDSSFGPGISIDYDSNAYVAQQTTPGLGVQGVAVRLFDAQLNTAVTLLDEMLGDPMDGILYDEYKIYRKGELLAGEALTTQLDQADKIRLYRFDGRVMEFDLIADDPDNLLDKFARLTKLKDRNNQQTTITYQPMSLRKIQSVTDPYGNQMTFSYGATVAMRPAVTSINLPGGESVSFSYSGDYISQVDLPGGHTWTCAVGLDPVSQCATLTINSPATGVRVYRVAPDFMEYNEEIIGQPANFFRSVVDGSGNNRLSVFPQYESSFSIDEAKVMYGNDTLAFFDKGHSQRYYTFWYLENGGDSYDDLQGTLEPTWTQQAYHPLSELPGNTQEEKEAEQFRRFLYGAPQFVHPADGGPAVEHSYDSEIFLTRRDYADGSFEEFEYHNDFKLLERYRNRVGNVTLYEYDTFGNLTIEKVGIKDVNGTDVNQAEYAEYKYDYFTTPGPLFGKLKTAYSPLHTGQTDMYRTDYTWHPLGQLKEVIGAADSSGGPRPVTTYAWTNRGQVDFITDSLNHVTDYVYDDRGRLIQTAYPDGSTEVITFGLPGSGNDNRVIWRKNRSDIVTSYTYDSIGRLVEEVSGSHTSDSGGTTLTAITDVTQQRITTLAYPNGSGLPSSRTVDGKQTQYMYDYRHRTVATNTFPRTGKMLTTYSGYWQNRLFWTQDANTHREYYAYSASNASEMIRRVQFTHTTLNYPNTPQDALNMVRDSSPNAEHIIVDAIKDANGNLLETIDGRGYSTKYTYDSRGRETIRRDAQGTAVEAKTETIYDVSSNVVEVRSPRYFDSADPQAANMRTLFSYTGRGLQSSQTVAAGAGSAQAITSQTYTLDGKTATRTDAGSNVWTSVYDDSCCGQFTAQKDPLGHGNLYNSDSSGRTVHSAVVSQLDLAIGGTSSKLDPADGKTLMESTTRYDILGRPVARTTWLLPRGLIDKNNPPIAGLDGVPVEDGITSQTYYDSNLTDGVGLDNATGMAIKKLGGGTYNLSLSAVLAQAAAAEASGGALTSFESGVSAGSAVVSIGPDESISVSVSDGLGRSVISAQLQPWDGPQPFELVSWACSLHDLTGSVNSFGNVITSRSIDPLGKTVVSYTDGAGRTLETHDQLGNITQMTYDAGGNVLAVRDPNGVGYDAVYDELGRMTSQTDTWGDTVSMTYDKEGNVLTQTDAKTKVTTMVYDARNRKTMVTDRLSGVTQYNYNCCHLVSIVDAEQQMTGYEYNTLGQKTKEIFPDHVSGQNPGDPNCGFVTFEYDPAGRMFRKTDQLGETVTMNYNMASQMHQRDYRTLANSPTGTIADSDQFDFDQAGRMTSALSQRYTNVVSMTYDYAGRLSTESLDIANQTYTVTREYDQLNRIKKYIYPDGTPVERTYTNRGQLSTIKYNGSVIDTRTYDTGGRLSTSTYSNGAATTWNYRTNGNSKDNLLASIVTDNPGANKVGTYSYTWDANKNKTAETITNSPLSGYGFSTGTTGYDSENRVTAWNRTDNNQNQSWNLSLVGDWNTFTQTGTTAITQTRTHGPTHEFTSFTGTTSGTITYDAKGNMLTRPSSLQSPALSLTWDFDNRLIGADTDSIPTTQEVTFQYDALGRRIARTENAVTTVYFQAGQQTIADYLLGSPAATSLYRYVYGSYIDEPVMRATSAGNVKRFFHRNQQYSITAMTDNAGAVLERYAYSAYGEVKFFNAAGTSIASSNQSNRYTYTGREWDGTLALYYFRTRWFDSDIGGFTTRDRLGYVNGMSQYQGYFANGSVDPFGEDIAGRSVQETAARTRSELSKANGAYQRLSTMVRAFVEGSEDGCVDVEPLVEEFLDAAEDYIHWLAELWDATNARYRGTTTGHSDLMGLPVSIGGFNLFSLFPDYGTRIQGGANNWHGQNLAALDALYNTLWVTDKVCTAVGFCTAFGAIKVGIQKNGAVFLCKTAGTFAGVYATNKAACGIAKACGASEQHIQYAEATIDIINLAVFHVRRQRLVGGKDWSGVRPTDKSPGGGTPDIEWPGKSKPGKRTLGQDDDFKLDGPKFPYDAGSQGSFSPRQFADTESKVDLECITGSFDDSFEFDSRWK